MKFLLDSAKLSWLEDYASIIPIVGVTTNPTILLRDGIEDVPETIQQMQQLLTADKEIHLQVKGTTYEEMKASAEDLLNAYGQDIYIKVPVNEPGMKLIQELRQSNYKITATAIYNEMQCYLAIAAGVDYIAPYFNRMSKLNVDSANLIARVREVIDREGSHTQILAASFQSVDQVNQAIAAGAHAVTVNEAVAKQLLNQAVVDQAVVQFDQDMQEVEQRG